MAVPGTGSLAVGALAAASTVGAFVVAPAVLRARPALAGILLVVAVAELLAADRPNVSQRDTVRGAALTARSGTANALGDPSHGRVLALGDEPVSDTSTMRRDLRPNAQVLDELRSVDGYDGGLLNSRDWGKAMARLTRHPDLDPTSIARRYMDRQLEPRLFSELDVTRVVAHQPRADPAALLPPGSMPLRTVGDVTVWSTPSLGPVFLDDGPAAPGLLLQRDGRVLERLVVHVPAAVGGRTVVVSEAYAPGWRADRGRRLSLHDGLLMSFVAPPGGGRVTLRYRTPGIRLGALVSLVALVLTTTLLVLGRRPAQSSG